MFSVHRLIDYNSPYLCMYVCIHMCSIIMESSTNNRHTIETQYGTMPTDMEAFSLWLTALSNISEKGQYQLLLCQDTVHRLQKCVVQAVHTFIYLFLFCLLNFFSFSLWIMGNARITSDPSCKGSKRDLRNPHAALQELSTAPLER